MRTFCELLSLGVKQENQTAPKTSSCIIFLYIWFCLTDSSWKLSVFDDLRKRIIRLLKGCFINEINWKWKTKKSLKEITDIFGIYICDSLNECIDKEHIKIISHSYLRILSRKKQPQIKLQRLQKVWIWTFL